MDLFGDIGDISSESDDGQQPPVPGQPFGARGLPRDQPEEEPASAARVDVEVPHFSSDLGNELYFVKLPRFLSIEPKPFDPRYYEDEFADEKVLDEEDRTRLRLKVENTVRWRVRRDGEGNEVKESNTRIVKWSDGSMSLHLGSEVFDVYKAPLQGNHSHLFVREDTGLQGQAVFKSRLTFRPHSTDYATHKKMTLPLADRCSGTQKIRILPMAGRDPECQRTEKIKREEERLRASARQGPTHPREKQSQQESRSDSEEEEEQDRIYSSDSDEGLGEEKPEGLPRAKQPPGDEVNPPEIGKQGVKRKRMT